MLSLHFATFDCLTSCPRHAVKQSAQGVPADLLQILHIITLDRWFVPKNVGGIKVLYTFLCNLLSPRKSLYAG